ncbi:Serine/threonine-protein phosphatase 4 catalytic subunit [Nosema granulosis]|uniref:protein-serine/threonine phosphatase n=1 Tax=Nosema granulosis TaxID=83296 RepID=A0A9P6H0R7_9MICR|nr:Serine/threonine-protein phosphatase 4 catalytic subunit [Nosema granulosis]
MHKYINKILKLHKLSESEIEEICIKAIEILIDEPNLPHLQTPVIVCGDIHGQFPDLVNMLKIDGPPPEKTYIFLGDYVDRGTQSVECFSLLLVYKILHPRNIYLCRGNHEQNEITKMYGFYDEVMQKYGNIRVWRMFCEVFSFLNVGCIVDGRVLCVHGGISPYAITINKMKMIDRFTEIPQKSIYSDIMWSDPHEKKGFSRSQRGTGYYFGPDVTNTFLEINDLLQIVRSHQLVLEGYKFHFPDRNVVTVWGAPNYLGRCNNPGSFLRIDSTLDISDQNLCIYQSATKEEDSRSK